MEKIPINCRTDVLWKKKEQVYITYLLVWVGEKGWEIYDNWTDMSSEERNSLQAHFHRFQKHMKLKFNPLFARYKFRNVTLGNNSMEQFITN